jgi:MFS family permease
MIVSDKWLTMALLCLSGGLIYWLPFLSEIYFVPMQDAFGFSKTQIGILSGTFGFMSLIGYFPGGWLADRFSSRKLLSFQRCRPSRSVSFCTVDGDWQRPVCSGQR